MAAAVDTDAGVFYVLQRFYIDTGGSQKRLAESRSQLFIVSIQRFFCHLKHLAHQGKTIAVHAGGSDSDQDVSGSYFLPCDQVFFINNTYGETCKVIFILFHKSRMLRSLSADQSGSGLKAAFRYASYDLGDLFRIVLAAGNIIQEKQRFTARAGNIVHAHCHSVDSDRVMFVHYHGKLYLGSASVGPGYQSGFLHILESLHGKSSGETADSSKHFRSHGFRDMFLHQFH